MRRLVAILAFVLASGIMPAIGANVFSSTVVIGMSTRAGGTFSFSNVIVPIDVRGLGLTLDISEATSPLPSITVILEGSLDGGTTWGPAGSAASPAGPKPTDRFGAPLTTLSPSFIGGDFWNATTNPNRRLRGSATIGDTMRFALTVQPL